MDPKTIVIAAVALGGIIALYAHSGTAPAPTVETEGNGACAKAAEERWKRPSDADIKERLTPEQYDVTQKEDTEPPFHNAYWDNHADGIYVDVVSGEPLFSSRDKYGSGTGWPSFHTPLEPDLIVEHTDYKLIWPRTEVRSRIADSHLGHVFDDGPAPTGLRYCINSAALRFVPATDLEREGYGEYRALFEKDGKDPKQATAKPHTEVATFGMGCFWGAEAKFCGLEGVVDTKVGYAGGHARDPGYRQVSSGGTGHAEVVQVEYDPTVVSYAELLDAFWKGHDPTTPNRQGPDVGSQYRSLILVSGPEQETAALASLEREARTLGDAVVTQIVPAGDFYPAEEYHQHYLEKHGWASCRR